MAEIRSFSVGHCTHPACMVQKGAGFASRCFPSRAFLISTLPSQTLATCELAFRALCGRRNLLEQSTQDIEWNGEGRGNHA